MIRVIPSLLLARMHTHSCFIYTKRQQLSAEASSIIYEFALMIGFAGTFQSFKYIRSATFPAKTL